MIQLRSISVLHRTGRKLAFPVLGTDSAEGPIAGSVVVSDFSQASLIEEARAARAEAERSRRLARQIFDHQARDALLHYAEAKDAKASELEQLASNTKPAWIGKHAQVQQMQQVQLEQRGNDETSPRNFRKSDRPSP